MYNKSLTVVICMVIILISCGHTSTTTDSPTNHDSSPPAIDVPRQKPGTVKVDVQDNGCQIPLESLRSQSGGYCRGPGKDRVIVFVNGIFGDAIDTWSSVNSYWPALLAKDPAFSDADIYVHSFNSPKIGTAQDIDELAVRMGDYLETAGVFSRHKQVVFLCHSMGGLVTRAYLLKTRPKPSVVPMIYFFATPTTGANVAGIASHLSANPQLKYMLPIKEEGYVGDLQNAWLSTSNDPALNYPSSIASYCAYEKLDTWGVRIVERESATNLCNRETRAVLKDHIGIVKPDDPSQEPYVYFKAAYLQTFGPISNAIHNFVASEEQRNTAPTLAFRLNTEQVGSQRLTIRTITTSPIYEEVGCNEEHSGTVSGNYVIPANEQIVSVIPMLTGVANLSSSSVALVHFDESTALVAYRLRGLDRNLFGNCPGGGHANVVVNVATILGALSN